MIKYCFKKTELRRRIVNVSYRNEVYSQRLQEINVVKSNNWTCGILNAPIYMSFSISTGTVGYLSEEKVKRGDL